MRPFNELKNKIFSIAGDIFGKNSKPYNEKSWLSHPKFVTFLDLCLICTEIEEVIIICPTRFTSGTDLKVSFYMNGEFFPKVQGEPIDRIKIHTHRFWTKKQLSILEKEIIPRFEKSKDEKRFFDDCFYLAVNVINRMKELNPERKIIQVCGPISTGPGSAEDKLIRFNKNIYNLEEKGYLVFDQMPFELAFWTYYHWAKDNIKNPNDGILNLFYKQIIESGLINEGFFSHDYNISEGARWEFELMRRLGMSTNVLPENFILNFWGERIEDLDMFAHYEYLLQKEKIEYIRDKFSISSVCKKTDDVGFKSELSLNIEYTGFGIYAHVFGGIGENVSDLLPEQAINEFKNRLSVFKLESKSSA